VVELKRRHIGNVQEALDDVPLAVAQLVKKRDERRDSFASGIKTAMATPFGEDAEEVVKTLAKHGVSSRLAEQVEQVAASQASFSVFGIVDALTRIAGRDENAGDRLVVDQKAASLLSLAA
jgi:hypothetical protein